MADNSVTIALKLDTSQFNAGLAQAQAQLSSMSAPSGRSGGKAAMPSVASGFIDFNMATKKATKETSHFANTIAYLTSILRGNISSFNVLGAMRGGMAIPKQAVDFAVGKTGLGQAQASASLSGIEGMGEGGMAAATASTEAAASLGVIASGVVTDGLAIVAAVGILGLILAAVAVLVVVMEAVTLGIKPILAVLKAIGKVIGAALTPIAMVIMTLLAPLIIMFMPFIKIMRAIFSPFQKFLAEALKSLGAGNGGNFLQNYLTAVGMALVEFAGTIVPQLIGLGKQALVQLQPLFDMLAGWITGFLTLDLAKIHEVVNDLLGTQLGAVINGMIDIGYMFISGIAGFLAQLIGKDMFDKMLGPGKFDEISKMNSGFAVGADLGKALKTLIDSVLGFAQMLVGDPKLALVLLGETILGTVQSAILMLVDAMETVVIGLVQMNNPVLNSLMNAIAIMTSAIIDITLSYLPKFMSAVVYLSNIMQYVGREMVKFMANPLTYLANPDVRGGAPAYVGMTAGAAFGQGNVDMLEQMSASLTKFANTTDVQGRVDEIALAFGDLKGLILSLSADAQQRLAQLYINSFPEAERLAAADRMAAALNVQDFVMQPGGRVIRTSPQDYVFGTKDPGSLGGGNSPQVNLTFNVEGSIDERVAQQISSQVQREVATLWRGVARM